MGTKDAATGLTYSIQNDATGAELFDRLITFADAIIVEARKSSDAPKAGLNSAMQWVLVRSDGSGRMLTRSGVSCPLTSELSEARLFESQEDAWDKVVDRSPWYATQVLVTRQSKCDGERLRDLEELTRERDEARARAEAGDKANARLEARNAELEAQLAKVREFVAAFGGKQ